MEKYFEFLLIFLVLVVDWHRYFYVCVVELNVLWLQVWTSEGAEHAGHLEAEVATLHSWLFLERSVELHAWDPFSITPGGTNYIIDLWNQLTLQRMHHTFLKFVTKLPNKKSLECCGAACLHIAMDSGANMILGNLEIKVDTFEREHVSAIIQLLPRGLNGYVEMHELGSHIYSSFHGNET